MADQEVLTIVQLDNDADEVSKPFLVYFYSIILVAQPSMRSWVSTIVHFNSPLISFFGSVKWKSSYLFTNLFRFYILTIYTKIGQFLTLTLRLLVFHSRFHPHTCTCIYITELLVPGSSRGAAGQWFHNIHIQCHVFIDKQITLCIYLPEISLSMRSMHDSMHSYFNLLLKCYVPVYDTILTYFLCRWHIWICAWSAYDV